MTAPVPIAVWDWEREPLPDAHVVVCRPGFLSAEPGPTAAMCNAHLNALRAGVRFIHPEAWDPGDAPAVIPALYAERQTDLARLPNLLAVKAERRALVLCPREAIDIEGSNAALWDRLNGVLNLVVIIPPPDARKCGFCSGKGEADIGRFGAPVRCWECSGKGRLDPWPMHPAWIRSIVEQCRAAGVPVAFLGWGAWVPLGQSPRRPERASAMALSPDGQEVVFRVGPQRSGRLLDGAEVINLPAWLTQEDGRVSVAIRVSVGGASVECRSATRTASGFRLSLRFAGSPEWVEADASQDGWVGCTACFSPDDLSALCSPETARSQSWAPGGVHPPEDGKRP